MSGFVQVIYLLLRMMSQSARRGVLSLFDKSPMDFPLLGSSKLTPIPICPASFCHQVKSWPSHVCPHHLRPTSRKTKLQVIAVNKPKQSVEPRFEFLRSPCARYNKGNNAGPKLPRATASSTPDSTNVTTTSKLACDVSGLQEQITQTNVPMDSTDKRMDRFQNAISGSHAEIVDMLRTLQPSLLDPATTSAVPYRPALAASVPRGVVSHVPGKWRGPCQPRDAWPLAVASVKFPDSVVPVASASGKTRPLHLPARADLYLQVLKETILLSSKS